MPVEESDYIDIEDRCATLGIKMPDGVCVLPRGFESAPDVASMMHEATALDIKVLLREAKIPVTIYQPDGTTIPYIKENANDWIGPTIFISLAAISQDPTLVALSLGVISNHLSDLFKGVTQSSNVSFALVVEETESKVTKAGTKTDSRRVRKFRFNGPAGDAKHFLDHFEGDK